MSRLTFRYGFSSNTISDLTLTRRQPIQGVSTYLTIEIPNQDDISQAQQIELIDLYGNILVKKHIQLNNNQSNLLYSTIEKFLPPAHNFFFYIRLSGIDSNGHVFQRSSSTALTSFIPLKPVVSLDSNQIQIQSNVLSKLQCHVQSQLPYHVQWSRDEQILSTSDYP